MKKLLLICLLLTLTLSFGATAQISAQENIITRQTLDQEIATLRTSYRNQLEEYRTAERQAQVANGQYEQLGTLTALESAVTTTRKAMILRATVLESYLTLLRLQLTDATGINLTDKDRTLTNLDTTLAELAKHRQQVEVATDRLGITSLATEFIPLGSQLESVAYEAQSLLAVGRLQTIYDKTVPLSQEIRDSAGETTELKKAERDRAYNEIQTTLTAVKNNIDRATGIFNRDNVQYTRSNFSNVLRDLSSVYTGLSQSLSYLSELLII